MPAFAPKPNACQGCPAYTYGCGFVPAEGPRNAPVALVGQGPGEQEAHFSRPFVSNAPSGSMLDRWLHKARHSRTQVLVANVVQCWLPQGYKNGRAYGNRAPTQAEVEYCWNAHVGPLMHSIDAEYVVPIGAPSARWFLGLGDGGIEKYNGTLTKLDLKEYTHVKRTDNETDGTNGLSGNTTRTLEGRTPSTGTSVLSNADRTTSTGAHGTRDKQRPRESGQYTGEAAPELQSIELSEMYEDDSHGSDEVSLLQRSAASLKPKWIMPLMHPSAVMRGRWEMGPVQEAYMKRVLEYAFTDAEPVLQDPTVPPPWTKLYPTLADIEDFADEVQGLGAYSLDIESAGDHIICVGMTAVNLDTGAIGTTVCLRFRSRGGGLYWHRWADHLRACELLQELLLLPVPKIFQNGITFDVPELKAIGFDIVGPYVDTMHLAHVAYCEMPKSLQFLGTLYLGAPVWKTLVDDEELEGKG